MSGNLTTAWEYCRTLTVGRDPIVEVISIESSRLRKKWIAFQNCCPREDRLDLQNSEPTVDGVVDMASKMMNAWQATRERSRGGRAILRFHRFCQGLDSHSNLLKILPEGNQYVSIFTGSLNAVMKVSFHGYASNWQPSDHFSGQH